MTTASVRDPDRDWPDLQRHPIKEHGREIGPRRTGSEIARLNVVLP
jgi:hypothetical protein